MEWNDFGNQQCTGGSMPHPFPDTCVNVFAKDSGDDDDGFYNPPFINPPPSISTTAFPTSAAMMPNGSTLTYCTLVPSAEPTQAPTPGVPTARPTTAYPTASTPSTASFAASQVSRCVAVLLCAVYGQMAVAAAHLVVVERGAYIQTIWPNISDFPLTLFTNHPLPPPPPHYRT